MITRLSRIFIILLLAVSFAAQPISVQTALADDATPPGNLFVKQAGPQLRLAGNIYRFTGANNYYLMYKSHAMVDDVLQTAASNGFRVLRMWGSLEIGNQDGSNSIQGKADGVYFQYWDGTKPAYNDGSDGLEHLDYVIDKAGKIGLKLVIPLVNNWNAFGGIDQYVRWANGQYHDQFFTDPAIRGWFKDWITHLLNRTNTYNGLQYKNDPTIMMWELANEPRCLSAGVYPRSANCTTQTLISWADEMSSYIKSIDAKHLVSVGDEGFYCIPGATDWTENCGEGVDTIAFTLLENIDVMSFHLYPDHWGKDAAWGTQWIKRHFADARKLDRPAMLGEYGWLDKSTRNPVFKDWADAVLKAGGAGALYWILSGKSEDGISLYPDYDGFTVYCPSPVCLATANFATEMNANKLMLFSPVADNDAAITEFETPVTLSPLANDITYGGASLNSGSLDLDPATTGQQTAITVYGGIFAAQVDGSVTFTPAAGFNGKSLASYTVMDSLGSLSNIAALTVTVKPSPTGALNLYSFETGTEGWGPASWNEAGTVTQTSSFHTDGNYSLQVESTNGGWFGLSFPAPFDLTGRVSLKFDLQTLAAGTSKEVAIQVGDSWTWCEGGGWGWTEPNTTTTIEIDLTSMSCGTPDLSKVQGMYVWFSGGGTFYMDYVRAE